MCRAALTFLRFFYCRLVGAAANCSLTVARHSGIPVVWHERESVFVPELVLGHLLTGSNFDDSVAKLTGGRNGCAFVIAPFCSA